MVRNKVIAFSVISILVLAIGYNLYIYLTPETTDLQKITVNLRDGEKSLKEIRDGENLLVILYNSNCDFCKKETEDMHSKLDQFEDVNILFLSRESFQTIEKYKAEYFPSKVDYVSFGSTIVLVLHPDRSRRKCQ